MRGSTHRALLMREKSSEYCEDNMTVVARLHSTNHFNTSAVTTHLWFRWRESRSPSRPTWQNPRRDVLMRRVPFDGIVIWIRARALNRKQRVLSSNPICYLDKVLQSMWTDAEFRRAIFVSGNFNKLTADSSQLCVVEHKSRGKIELERVAASAHSAGL